MWAPQRAGRRENLDRCWTPPADAGGRSPPAPTRLRLRTNASSRSAACAPHSRPHMAVTCSSSSSRVRSSSMCAVRCGSCGEQKPGARQTPERAPRAPRARVPAGRAPTTSPPAREREQTPIRREMARFIVARARQHRREFRRPQCQEHSVSGNGRPGRTMSHRSIAEAPPAGRRRTSGRALAAFAASR